MAALAVLMAVLAKPRPLGMQLAPPLWWLLVAGSTAAACTTEHDCSLLGDCVGGACVCDAGFKGITCCELDLAPASRHGGYRNHSQTSWGGQVLKGTPATGGFYHMYASAFVNNCSLKEFSTNSESVHAVSPTPGGPFRLADTALPPFHHSTTAIQAPDGTYHLFSIGKNTGGRNVHTCSGQPPPPSCAATTTEGRHNLIVGLATTLLCMR